jgi:hypothetical protein
MTSVASTVPSGLADTKRIGTGLALILFPVIFVFAFAVHPGLLNPHMLSDEEVVLRMHHNALLTFGHVLVLLDAALLIPVALYFTKLLDRGSTAWAGFIGGGITVLGAIALAAEKGAECLTMSAQDTLPENQFAQMMPGLIAIVSKQGWMILVWGVVLMAVGLSILAIALLQTRIIARWQSALLLIGIWLLGGPDGFEIVNLGGSILLAIALVPLGIQLIGGQDTQGA